MRGLPRRQSADDRHLKLIARADQKKADLNRNAAAAGDVDMKLRVRVVTANSRFSKNVLPLCGSRGLNQGNRVWR